ncbi:protein kinase domain-containing protein [Streptomyces atriruber]|uniref:protein kinase domain-containing protein n=1 Tax=Streptomyces atriruber TaxID=545121 RepID=UPI0006E21ED6|nr:serine/threonine-protein kinase [Streptomyces atriruber]
MRPVGSKYLLEEPLGRGATGTVWRARQRETAGAEAAVPGQPGETVAIKVLKEELANDADVVMRFLRERSVLLRLTHENIVRTRDLVVEGDLLALVMDLVEGPDLHRYLRENGPFTPVAAALLTAQIADALAASHADGVVHRDLKPANVLLKQDAQGMHPMLTDFGIAQLTGATTLTEVGSFVGSPEYTAPERMAGERTGPESDLWSLGALLATALAGESPFRRDSIGGVLHAVVFDEIRPPPAVAPLLPVVLGLLDRDPARRLGAAEAEGLLRVYVETGRMPAVVRERPGPGSPGRGLPGLPGRGLPGLPGFPGRPGRGGPTPAERELLAAQAAAGLVQPEKHGRTFMIAAALVAALAGAGVSAALLLSRGGDGGGTPAPSSATSSHGSPTPTVTVTSRTPTPSSPEAPQGYRIAKDPKGFALAVPEGFRRQAEGPRVSYASPDGTYRIGIEETAAEPGGPLAAQRRADAKGPQGQPGYRDSRVTETTRNGRPAALREFSRDGLGQERGARRTFDLCWEESGRMLEVWVSGPVGEASQARRYFDAAVDTFVRR